jgi:hypothetical protein
MAKRVDELSGGDLKGSGAVRLAGRHDREREARRQWAERELEKLRLKREAANAAEAAAKQKPKAKASKRSKARGSRKAALAEAQARIEVNRLVSKEAQQHGQYDLVAHQIVEVTEGGKRTIGEKGKEKTVNVVRNLGGTAIERWYRNHRLDDRRMTAIEIYQRAWHAHIGQPRTTANWNAVIVRTVSAVMEGCYAGRLDAKQLLRLFDQDIFFRRGLPDFNVWQNVVIGDEAAGVAGSRLGFKSKQAEAAALVIVQGVAHEIASLVVDQNPPDLSQLLLDIDAPRKPRRIS